MRKGERKSVGSREILEMRERGRERDWSRKRKPALANHPKMGYSIRLYACMHMRTSTLCTTNPAFDSAPANRSYFLFIIPYDVRYAHIPGVRTVQEMKRYQKVSFDSLQRN